MVECYKCHQLGHFKNECPTWDKGANFAELEEDVLLMALVELEEKPTQHIWFLDSGAATICAETKSGSLTLMINSAKT